MWGLNPTDYINEAVEIEALMRRATLRKCEHVCTGNCLHEYRAMLRCLDCFILEQRKHL